MTDRRRLAMAAIRALPLPGPTWQDCEERAYVRQWWDGDVHLTVTALGSMPGDITVECHGASIRTHADGLSDAVATVVGWRDRCATRGDSRG